MWEMNPRLRSFLKHAFTQLPYCLPKLYDRVEFGGMDSIKELEREIQNDEGQLINVCTPEERRQLHRNAASRLEKMRNLAL